MIQIDNLVKVYNEVKVLDIEQLKIPQGQSFGLVGNNGAGKTTLFRLILDLIKADQGQVLSKDIAVNKDSQWKNRQKATFLLRFRILNANSRFS